MAVTIWLTKCPDYWAKFKILVQKKPALFEVAGSRDSGQTGICPPYAHACCKRRLKLGLTPELYGTLNFTVARKRLSA